MPVRLNRYLASAGVGSRRAVDELPDIKEFDPEPELEQELRERLLRAGEARAGGAG